jgi:hypothetical protein
MKGAVPVESASAFIDRKIEELGGWRGKTLARVRTIIHKADPEIVEEWKRRGDSRVVPRRHRLHGKDPATSLNHAPERTAGQHTLHSSVRH